jgi:hypothetical protein
MRRVIFLFVFSLLLETNAIAEPCLLIYPLQNTVFRYDPSKYTTLTSADPRFDPAFDRGGLMLWDLVNNRVACEVYQAPNLQGFVQSSTGRNEYFVARLEVDLVVDGFYTQPRRLNDIIVLFQPVPYDAILDVAVSGNELDNYRHFIPSLMVDSPIHCCFYSDTVSFNVEWLGAKQVIVTAFADKDGNDVFYGEPCFDVLLEDPWVPTENTTWGRMKAIYNK